MNHSDRENLNRRAAEVSLAPWLTVLNVVRALDFYKLAFGAEEVYRLEIPENTLQVARLSVKGAEFWISEGKPALEDIYSDAALEGGPVRMILTVPNPDQFYSDALKAGAIAVFPVSEAHGWRVGRLKDPFGLHWEIGRYVGE